MASDEGPKMKVPRLAPEEPTVVMMNGLPGAMGMEIGKACIRAGCVLAPVALTGSGAQSECDVVEGCETVTVKLVARKDAEAQRNALEKMRDAYGERLVIVDFSHPSSVNVNADLYNAVGVAFVFGTTGGDRDALLKSTQDSGVYAVIAPNMSKQIVALQATMARMAQDFPGAFSGYSLAITESHQKTKADTSGTAKAMVASFEKLGLDFKVDQIAKIREEDKQMAFGVPQSALSGHAFHTYALTSGDGSVGFEFKHNVCGRRTYAEGVMDAVLFLAKKRSEKNEQRVFNMIDVLEAGAMR
eukprot:TRINITY_DN71051_c0_g1_i1.p1 TRINITY_DN71051_c0_g1~~TRINITY_DN71051_c0_g1_i1.p1  ORF type:complete len:301 (-),score=70.24 TRINITY_DN71051_c0_g1_i1:149-1051(-)